MILNIQAQFADLPQLSKHNKTGITWFSDRLYICARIHLMWYLEFNTLGDFLIYMPMICVVLGSNLSNLPQCPNYTKASATWPSDGIYMWVGLHLMWNVEFGILDVFLCIWAHCLGYLGSISPTWPDAKKNTKSGRTQPLDGLYPWKRLHLMWNIGSNTLDDFLHISALLWGIWVKSPWLTPILQIH